jgi:hypothetical protein
MDKLTYLQAQDIENLQKLIENHIEQIHSLACETNHIRYERRDHPVNGVLIALENRETELKAQVQAELEGIRSNEDMRSTLLARKKALDTTYLSFAQELNSINMELDQKQIDITWYTGKYQAAIQALKFKTASLRFLAEV